MNLPVKSREGRSHDGLSTGGEQLERAPPEPTEAKQESLLHEEAMASGHTKQEAGDKLVPNTDSAMIDPMSEIYRFTPMPLPTTSRRNNSDLAQPGAYGVVGAPNFHRFRAPRRQDSDEAETAPPPEIEGLAVANLVTEEDRDNLPTARPQQMGREREQESKKFKTKIFVGVILIVACVLIVLTVLVPNNKDESSRAPTKTPSASPSEAPTTLMDSILSLLPMETIVTITEDAESPQSEALDWLMQEGHELRLSLSSERILQKFALATLFFATAGEAWIDHTNWLNHSVNECDWFNKPEFAGVSTWRTFLGEGFLQGFFPGDEQPAICGDDGLYQHLWLDENNLAGSLPMELYLLTNLQTMSLSNNRLQGSISSHIGQLGSMQGLFLNRMVESGQIPSEIGLLTKLKALVLLSNSHDGTLPSELWKLSELDTLLLSGNRQLQGTLATEIGNFHQMRWLGLDACDLHGTIPSEIGTDIVHQWSLWDNPCFFGKIDGPVLASF
ncbi:Leucine Rich Repeat [Seminavis robusta]|uniref:Leucine Rich Repeat n=1 Tax=Seminavis robusta TaxID=568900 RepID=A0A9N8EKJ3_9STRA|nr:Leucine Rich Repeat [Seminavis robusta]|eukprot:Sro1150_g246700.1 Leucine Rich Repeat (501) ;mRNA; r:31621-33292